MGVSTERVQHIQACLETLEPTELRVEDEGHLHVGHVGARAGGGHFRVRIVTPLFAGLSRVERHRRVYAVLGDALRSEIHALAITALAPGEDG